MSTFISDFSFGRGRFRFRGWGGTSVVVVACGVMLAGGLVATATVSMAQPPTFSAIPAAGSRSATSATDVTLRSPSPTTVSSVIANGSISGSHPGAIRMHPDGRGATFHPSRPFAPGETVSVTSTVGGVASTYSFAVAVTRRHPGLTANGELRTGPQGATPSATTMGVPVTTPAYRTRPDLRPPAITVDVPAQSGVSAGMILATPSEPTSTDSGVMIYDNDGQVVWFHPVTGKIVGDASVQTLAGQPVLTWFEGTAPYGAGNYRGEYVVTDSSYRVIKRLRMGNGYQADIHSLLITPQNTAIMIAYNPLRCDGVSLKGCQTGSTVLDGVVQEVDIASGAVLFEWHAIDHLPLSDSYQTPVTSLFDFLHPNSVDLDSDGDILLSGRHTSALYKIDRSTGAVLFIFGGKRNQFTYVNEGSASSPGPDYPHDFRARGSSTYSYFDNGIRRAATVGATPDSRGVVVTLDASSVPKTATYTKQLHHDPPLFGPTQGRMQEVAGGGNFIAWGGLGVATEYDSADQPVFEATIAAGTYRQVRQPWTGTPSTVPNVVVTARTGSSVTAAVSWNGDTRTAYWRMLSGPTPTSLVTVRTMPRTGFETLVTGPATNKYVAVEALDSDGDAIPGGRGAPRLGAKWFTESAAPSVGGAYRPLVGDFGGSRNDDVIYYAPGAGADYVHVSDGAGGFTDLRLPAVSGDYRSLVGDFVGDDRDEVIWWSRDSGTAFMWRFDRAARTVVPVIQSAPISVPAAVSVATVMNNRPAYGGGKDEALWYTAGSAQDRIDRFGWVAGKPLTRASRTVSVNGSYTPVTGDFDGNGLADILWYAPGTAADSIWLSTGGAGGSSGYIDAAVRVNGTYAVRAGNFYGTDAADELFFYSPGPGADNVWSFGSTGTITSITATTAATGTAYVLQGAQDVVMTWSGGTAPNIWEFGPGAPLSAGSGNSAVAPGYTPLVGDFTGPGGTSSVLWYRAGADPEVLYAAAVGTAPVNPCGCAAPPGEM